MARFEADISGAFVSATKLKSAAAMLGRKTLERLMSLSSVRLEDLQTITLVREKLSPWDAPIGHIPRTRGRVRSCVGVWVRGCMGK